MKRTRSVTARLTEAATKKLHEMSQAEELTASEIIMRSIEARYELAIAKQRSAWKALEQNGFIGCGQAAANLSSNYKKLLSSSLHKKYDHR